MKFFLIFFSIISFSQTQKFIVVDEETIEFIDKVNYTLYLNNHPIYQNQTSKDTITFLPNKHDFDSISFTKLNYKEIGFLKKDLTEVVTLKKTIYELNEVVISNAKEKETLIGENFRFIKKRSTKIFENLDQGLLIRASNLDNKTIERLTFFVEKVNFKTNYKIKFYAAEEVGNYLTELTLEINELLFESPILTLKKDAKNQIDVSLKEYEINTANKNIFIVFELQNYFDENDTIIQPKNKDKTKLKFQISKQMNYYSRMSDMITSKLTKDLININAMLNKEYAFKFYKKPHKSFLTSPAILLYVKDN